MKIKNLVQGLITFFAVVLALAVILAFVIPLLSATLLNGKSSGVKSLSLFSVLKITFYTIRIAFFSTLLSFIVGISASFFTARRTFFGRSFLLSLAAIPLCVPPLIIALGFVTVFGISGIANKMLVSVFRISSRPTSFLYSSLGIVIAQGFYNFPLVMKIVSDSWESNSEEEENAARLLGAREFRIFFTITLHKLFPAILASCIPVFLYCFFSFMIVLLFGPVGRSVLEAEIYRAAKITLNYNDVTSLALVETFCALLIVSFYSTIKKYDIPIKSKVYTSVKKIKLAKSKYKGKTEKIFECIVFYLVIAAIFLFLIFPLFGIFASALSQKNKILTFLLSKNFLSALRNTLLVAPCTASLCVSTARVYSCFLRLNKFFANKLFFQLIPLLPLAVSSVVIAFGVTRLNIYPSIFALVLMEASLSWPLAFRIIFSRLQAMPNSILESSMLLEENPLDTVFKILLPFLKSSIFSAFGFCLATSAGDATLPLVLSIPKFTNLSLLTYRLASSYRFNEACISGTILAIICFAFFSLEKLWRFFDE